MDGLFIEIFSETWWKWISCTAFTITVLLFWGARANENQNIYIRYTAAACLFLSATLNHPYLYFAGKWSIQTSLPLHLCTILNGWPFIHFSNQTNGALIYWHFGE
ncbi:hypothetical protein BH23BAC1_BH23BAC1_08890 [soil metagenome]